MGTTHKLMDAALNARFLGTLSRRSIQLLVVPLRVRGNDMEENGLLPQGRLATAILPLVSGGTWATKSRHNLRGGVIGKLVGEGHGQILPQKKKSAMRKIILAISPHCGQSNAVNQPHQPMIATTTTAPQIIAGTIAHWER